MIIARLSLEYWLLEISGRLGSGGFIAFSVVVSVLLCFLWIPKATDVMVNASAGLAGKYLGRHQRTLVINISTNNPELFSMLVAFFMLRLGGVANPLGSNFANIYLMFGVALIFSLLAVARRKGKAEAGRMLSLLWTERRLVVWHLIMSLFLFGVASVAYYLLVGVDQFGLLPGEPRVPAAWKLLVAVGALFIGIVIFVLYDRRLKRQRPGLYLDIDETGHSASWGRFVVGTSGLILACWLMNALFLVWTELYGTTLASLLGPAVFVALHFFVGALVTSLPEMTVAIKNFTRMTSADLNTALASASFSNMANLAIALLGSVIAAVLLGLGLRLVL